MKTNQTVVAPANFAEKFDSFVVGCNKIKADYNSSKSYQAEHAITVNKGRKYMKLVEARGGGYCFVNRENGDVLKAASWASPAKGARGNIFDGANGLARMGPCGAAYNN